jgi:hypothetical protein
MGFNANVFWECMHMETMNFPRKSGWAIASLVLGIVGLLTFVCAGVLLCLLAAALVRPPTPSVVGVIRQPGRGANRWR